MKKKTIKIISAGIAAALCAGIAAGCNPSFDDNTSGATEITFRIGSGCCLSDTWLKPAFERFSELKKNESYEDGKTGVYASIMQDKMITSDTTVLQYDIIIGEANHINIYDMQAKGWLHNIDNIVSKFDDKIDKNIKERMKGSDGKYYSMPMHSFYCNISYNVSLFDNYNLYFAAPEETDVEEYASLFAADENGKYTANGGTVKFIGSKDANKSCGPNGEYGDYDDGLPSSVEEFLVLCDYVRSERGINPFAIYGDGGVYDYGYMLVNAIWSGLVGEDIKNAYCDWTGKEVEVVKLDGNGSAMLTDEDLFYVGSGIKKPVTEKIVLNDENGYRMYDMVGRYYGLGVLQVAYKNGWFCQADWDGKSNFDTQKDFLYGEMNSKKDNRSAMLIDSSYWYGESTAQGNIESYAKINPTDPVPHVSIMPMPTSYTGQVAEHEGKKPILLDTGAAQMCVSREVEKNAGKLRAVEEFIEYFYNNELANFTEATGLQIAMDYSYDSSKLDEFYGRMKDITDDGIIIRPASPNARFKNSVSSFSLSWGGYINSFNLDGLDCNRGPLYAMVNNKDMLRIFEVTRRKTW